MTNTAQTALKRKIIRLRGWGRSYSEIMYAAECSEAWVYRVLREAKLVKKRKKVKAKRKATKATRRRG